MHGEISDNRKMYVPALSIANKKPACFPYHFKPQLYMGGASGYILTSTDMRTYPITVAIGEACITISLSVAPMVFKC
ncbi:MAG: hypothetical protein IPO27_14630 [Bacteroidetes bacterium]|nr:hypothetical protein [Bacteroidota bacterium]